MNDIIEATNKKLNENYYSRQLNKLEAGEYPITIQAIDGNGNKTNHLSLTMESIPEIIKYLQELNIYLKFKNKE